jgi:hypothetical protein
MNLGVIRIFLFLGQSNIAGADSIIGNSESDFIQEESDKACFMTYAPSFGDESSLEYVSWNPIKCHIISSSAHPKGYVIGPEVGFTRQIFSLSEPPLAVIKCVGNIKIDEDNWLWESGQIGFIQTIKFIQNRIKELKYKGWLPIVSGVIWDQGIDDGFHEKRANNHASHLKKFITSLREYFNDRNLPFVLSRSIFSPLANPMLMTLVREAQIRVVMSISCAAWIDIDDLEVVCSHHLSMQSQLEAGRRFAVTYQKLLSVQH